LGRECCNRKAAPETSFVATARTCTYEVARRLAQRRREHRHAALYARLRVGAALVVEGRAARQQLVGQHPDRPRVDGVAIVQVLLLLVFLGLGLVGAPQDLCGLVWRVCEEGRGDEHEQAGSFKEAGIS